ARPSNLIALCARTCNGGTSVTSFTSVAAFFSASSSMPMVFSIFFGSGEEVPGAARKMAIDVYFFYLLLNIIQCGFAGFGNSSGSFFVTVAFYSEVIRPNRHIQISGRPASCSATYSAGFQHCYTFA